ncbi:glycosyltransferase family 2 protein [Candidatus Gottesmanbacteria bacterium]|nr:glycosyltransferase family 2 protein [Candidatus Gottesmanbacteria bacterium]
MVSISVIIITRNRAALLDCCLSSIANQVLIPQEVVIVNNDSTDYTRSVITKYKKLLPIRSIREAQIGTPYARNAGIRIVKGDIVAFLDDDCTANDKWVSSIKEFFKKLPTAIGVIGNTSVANNKSVSALVEFAYNRRWVLTHIENPKTVCKIRSGVVIDSKNAAFRLGFIKHFLFSTLAPFGEVSNEDAEIGSRMFQQNHNIFYNPLMKASHIYSPTVSKLLLRNFWRGYGDQLLFLRNGIDLNSPSHKPKGRVWALLSLKISKHLPIIKKIILFTLLFIYPLFSRLGRLVAIITWKLKIPISIPQR